MPGIPSVNTWYASRDKKAGREYDKAVQNALPGSPEPVKPNTGTLKAPAYSSPGNWLNQRDAARKAPASNGPSVEMVPYVPDETATATAPRTYLAQKLDQALTGHSQSQRYALAEDALRASVPAVGDQRHNQADSDTWTANYNQKQALAEGILAGKVNVSQMAPQEIPWGVFNRVARQHSGPFAGDELWANLDALGTIDPVKAKEYLVQMAGATAKQGFAAGQQSLQEPGFFGGMAQGTQAGFSLGATQVAPGRTFGEKAGQFVGGVVGFLPHMFGMGAGPSGAGPAAGRSAEQVVQLAFPKLTAAAAGGNILAKSLFGAIQNTAMGAAIGVEGEGIASATNPNYTSEGALGRIAGRAAEFGAIGAASPVSESIMGSAGRAALRSTNPAVAATANLVGRAPEVVRHIGGQTVKGGLTGLQLGLVKGPLEAMRDPQARDVGSFVHSVITHAGEFAAQDAMMAIAMGIASGKIAPTPENILKASKTMAEMRPQSATRATGTDQYTADYHAEAQKLMDEYNQTAEGQAQERMAQEVRARTEGTAAAPTATDTAPQAQSEPQTGTQAYQALREQADAELRQMTEFLSSGMTDPASLSLARKQAEELLRNDPNSAVSRIGREPLPAANQAGPPPLDPPQGANTAPPNPNESPIMQQRQQEAQQISAEQQSAQQAGQQQQAQETQRRQEEARLAQLQAGTLPMEPAAPTGPTPLEQQHTQDQQQLAEERASNQAHQQQQAQDAQRQQQETQVSTKAGAETAKQILPLFQNRPDIQAVLQGRAASAQLLNFALRQGVTREQTQALDELARVSNGVWSWQNGVLTYKGPVDTSIKTPPATKQNGAPSPDQPVSGPKGPTPPTKPVRSPQDAPVHNQNADPFSQTDPVAQRKQHQSELADIKKGRKATEWRVSQGVKEIATDLARKESAGNEQARKELWQRIKDHGLIRAFKGGQMKEDLTSRIPSYLKSNEHGRPLDEIAADMGYASEEALVREIEAFAKMGKVKASDKMREAEMLWESSDGGRNAKAELDYFTSAEADVKRAMGELDGLPPDTTAAAQMPAQAGATPAADQTAPRSEAVQADHPMLDQAAQAAGFKDAAEARETVRAANAGDAAAEQRLANLEPAVRQLFDVQTTDTSGAQQVVANRQRQLESLGMPAADAELVAQGSANLDDAGFQTALNVMSGQRSGPDQAGQTFRPSQVKADKAPSEQSAFAVEGDAGASPGSAAGYAAKVANRLNQAPNREWKDAPESGKLGGRENAGAPSWFQGAKDMARLLSENLRLAKKGAQNRSWYEDNAQQILKLTGSPEEADKFFKLIAIYSPKTGWSENVLRAYRAYVSAKESAHLPPAERPPIQGIGLGWQDRAATELMANGKDWNGTKTNSFYRNFKTAIDPQADPNGVTVDVWMQAVNGFPAGPDGQMNGPTDAQYRFSADVVRRVAKELGWTPRQAQAAIWVAARSEAMGYPISESGISVDSIIKSRAKANMAVPLLPDQSGGILPGIHNATPEQQQEYSRAVVTALHAEDGTFVPAQLAGVPIKGATLITGTTGGEQAPVLSLDVVAPRQVYGGFGVRPESTQALDRLGAVLGILTRQPSVSWTAPIQNTPKFQQNGVLVDIGREITGLELGKVGGMIGDATGLSPDQFALVNTPDGLMIYHTAGEGSTDRRLLMTANDRFYQGVKDAIAGALGDDVQASVGRFGAVANRIENDWGTNQDGQGYRDRFPGAGSPAVQEGIRRLSAKLDGINQEFGQRYGWDQQQAQGDNAAGGTPDALTQSEAVRQAQSQVSASQMPDETAPQSQGGLSVDETKRREQEKLTASQMPPPVQSILPLFANRPDLQAVLEGKAASAPLLNVARGLTLQREQHGALDQLAQDSGGKWQVKDGNLVYQGTVDTPAQTTPAANQNGAPASRVPASGTTPPPASTKPATTPQNAPVHNQTAVPPPPAAVPVQASPPAAPKSIDQALQEARQSSKHNFEPASLAERIKGVPEAIRKGLGAAPDAISKGIDWYLTEFHDRNTSVNQLVKAAAKRAGVKELPTNQDPALALELLPKTAPGKAQAYWDDMRGVLKPVQEKLIDYATYADAKTALWRSQQFGYGDDLLPEGMSRANAQMIVEHFEKGPDAKLFTDTLANEQKLFNKALDQGVADGIVSPEARDAAKAAHQVYVPQYRDPEAVKKATEREARNPGDGQGRTGVNLPNALLRQTGGNQKLMDPVERRVRYFARMAGLGERAKVGQTLVNLHEADPNSKLMTKVAPPMEHVETKVDDILTQLEDLGFDPNDLADPNGVIAFFKPKWATDKNSSVITVKRNGKNEYWNVHNEGVLRAVADADQVTQNFFARGLQKAVDVYKLGATGTPSFTIANLIKDGFESWRHSKHQILPGHALFEAARLAADHDPFIKRVIDAGLKQGGFLSPEKLSLDMAKDIADPRRVKLSARGLWHLYQNARENPEFWTRLGESSLDYKARIKSGQNEHDAFLRALAEGGRITLNFTRAGRTMREVNRYVPFAKIPFEVMTREAESLTDHPGIFLTKTLAAAAAVGLASYLVGRDHPLKQEASDDERDRYFLVPMGKALVKVPKAQGPQGILINLVERTLRAHDQHDPEAFNGFAKSILGDLFPRVSNPAVEFLVATSGYSIAEDRMIVPQREQKLPPAQQYDERTSPSVRALSRVLPGKLQSPRVTQYAIDKLFPGYSEGFFKLENAFRQDAAPTRRIPGLPIGEDTIGIGRFISRPGQGKQGRSVNSFYDEFGKAEEVYNGVRDKVQRETGLAVKMNQLTPEQIKVRNRLLTEMPPADLALFKLYPGLTKSADRLSEVRKQLDAVRNNRSMTPDAKRREIERYNQLLTDLAKKSTGTGR